MRLVLNTFVTLVKHSIGNLGFGERRLALEALGIKVWIDGEVVAI